jgi:hypothetical protein
LKIERHDHDILPAFHVAVHPANCGADIRLLDLDAGGLRTKEPSAGNDKVIWILVIIFAHWIGALIYYLVRRPERKKLFGA